MEFLEKDLQSLIDQGKKQGYLTFEQVVGYLPDEANTPEKLDNLVSVSYTHLTLPTIYSV